MINAGTTPGPNVCVADELFHVIEQTAVASLTWLEVKTVDELFCADALRDLVRRRYDVAGGVFALVFRTAPIRVPTE